MKKGQEICVKRDRFYGHKEYKYQIGIVDEIYSHYILVRFEFENGNSYKEGFFKYELIKKEDLSSNACIY